MPLEPGARLGPYEVVSALGAGGMGEVWRARDRRLDRDVALKVLPELFVADPERLARFAREAKVLASLNHPHIGGIHGLEEADGLKALVLELVEGPTLADRIARGPIALEEALPIARQIAEALEAAHEQGIVHRDLKPANIKVKPDGTVKVLDFGLAKALEPLQAGGAVNDAALSHSPTLTLAAAATQMGVILGTAAYMAPEQARGRPVDKRADIWAFGAVLHETLTGHRAFAGDTASDCMVAILTTEPDWSKLPAATPPHVLELLRRCLTKDPRTRLRDIGDARFELERGGSAAPETCGRETRGARSLPLLAAVLLAGISMGAVAAWLARDRGSTASDRTPVKFTLDLPAGVILTPAGAAVSADGRSIAFTASPPGQRTRVWIRTIENVGVRAVPGTDGAWGPFWSPDGSWIGFFADGKVQRVRAAGGPVETLCDASGTSATGLGGAWSNDDVIVFSTSFFSGLMRVAAGGGTPSPLTTPNESGGEQAHVWPHFLPDGKRFAYTVIGKNDARRTAAVGSLAGGDPAVLFPTDLTPLFTARGAAAYLRGNAILAQRIDSTTLQSIGDPVVLATGASTFTPHDFHGAAGTLTYYSDVRSSTLAWYDRAGARLEIIASGVRLEQPALSPNGRVVVERAHETGGEDLWLYDERGVSQALTSAPHDVSDAVWSPDGERLVFSRGIGQALVELEPSGAERPLIDLGGERDAVYATDWSKDGSSILYAGYGGASLADVWMLSLSTPSQPVPLVRTIFLEHQARFSPDGRFIAYASDESGFPQVYVMAMPPAVGKRPITTAGGAQPMWSWDGRELFYVDLEGMLWSVAVETTSTFRAAVAKPLFRLSLTSSPFFAVRNDYAVSPDGQRFLVASVDPADAAKLNVIVDWEAMLEP